MRKFAGLDVGTTGAKIVVFGQDGALLDKVYQAYPSSRDKTKQELDASLLRDSVLSLFRRVLDKHPDLEGLGIASFGESFVCLDENDEPVYPILLYTDPRGKDECDRLIASIGEEAIEQKTGLKPHEMYSLPKLAYWKSHDPKGFSSVKKVFLMEDYCLYLLTGKRYIDYSLASRTLGFNLKEKGYDTDIFRALGLDPSLLSTPVPAGTPVRGLHEEFGPGHEDFIVLPAGHDQFACSLGSMVLKPGQAMEGAGTVECIVPLVKDIPDLRALAKDNYNLVPGGFFRAATEPPPLRCRRRHTSGNRDQNTERDCNCLWRGRLNPEYLSQGGRCIPPCPRLPSLDRVAKPWNRGSKQIGRGPREAR